MEPADNNETKNMYMKKINYKLILCIAILTSFQLNAQCVIKTKNEWIEYFKKNIDNIDPIEGIWNFDRSINWYNGMGNLVKQDKDNADVVIVKDGDGFTTCLINEEVVGGDIVRISKTANSDVYLYKRKYIEEKITINTKILLNKESYFKLSLDLSEYLKNELEAKGAYYGERVVDERTYIKTNPNETDYYNASVQKSKKESKTSGTGFAISATGLIATNNHVTTGATSIKVKGINGDFSKSYKAEIVLEDKNNDLSIIQIKDPNFITLGSIPYTISSKSSDVGTSVFVLGYPLRATMGDEIKLTNGIISSKSGYQGDVSSYQITAPIQPGNSGGPLFDNKGNVIGVINAKHSGAENVSYGIKASYLINLIDLMNSPPKLPLTNLLNTKSLTEQVKILKKYTYILEITYE